MKCQVVIPARLASTRLPRKLLLPVDGRPLIAMTHAAARRAQRVDGVVVAVDSPELAAAVDGFGGQWVMTSPECASGTDRVAEVARARPEVDVFINVQGDEPEIDPEAIDRVVELLENDPQAEMATAAAPLRDPRLLDDPACVKIALGTGGVALYFSRSAIPHLRDGVTAEALAAEPPLLWHHIGLYAYRRRFLEWFAQQPPGRLEQAERLEQLRALENGRRVVVGRVERARPGIDTQADYDALLERIGECRLSLRESAPFRR